VPLAETPMKANGIPFSRIAGAKPDLAVIIAPGTLASYEQTGSKPELSQRNRLS
jgi:hypothetical protein